MNYDDARLKHGALVADAQKIQRRAEWHDLERLERLMRSVRVVRARLGIRVLASEQT